MNRLKADMRKAVLAALVEGSSINSIAGMTGVSKVTILKLLRDLGGACAADHNDHLRGLKPVSVKCDEVWSFNFCKANNVAESKRHDISYGEVWTWTALDPHSRLMITYLVGTRSPGDARAFMADLAYRVIDIGTLTMDGYTAYPEAVQAAFALEVPYVQLMKKHQTPEPSENRYSPSTCIGREKLSAIGYSHVDHISTSHVERSKLTDRMSMGGHARLTSGHSKRIQNHGHAFSLFVMHYNFCRRHSTLSTSPAMAAGLADHIWTLDELIGLMN